MLRLILIVLACLLAALIGAFAYMNAAAVELHYLFGIVNLPMAFIVATAFLLGVIFALLMLFPMYLSKQNKIRGLNNRLKTGEQELKNLRNMPLKDEL